MFSYIRLEERVSADHPLREIRRLADEALSALNGRLDGLYSGKGRPSIAPEMMLRATLRQAFFSMRLTPEGCLRHDAPVDRADRLQPAIPVVRRTANGRCRLV